MKDDLQRRLEFFRAGLKNAGVKLTHQRLEVCREIAVSTEHPDAERVFSGVRERVPTISLDTVYRTLSLLVDLGLIDRLGASQETMHFDGNMTPHHHFICTKCGATHDFYNEEFNQLMLPDDAQALGQMQKVQVTIRGTCKKCSQKG